MDTAVHLCLRKICLAYLDDIKVYVFIKNMDIFNPDECEKPAASKKKKRQLFVLEDALKPER